MWSELIQGFTIGLTVSVPVGPVALLIIRRSIEDGRMAGIVSGLGAATVDLVYGSAAALGLKALTLAIEHHEHLLRAIGGLFLLGYGLHTLWTREPAALRRNVHEQNLRRAYFTTAVLTIANPLTWMGLVFVSAAAGVGTDEISLVHTGALVIGICAASFAWWTTLSTSAAWLGRKLGPNLLRTINTVAGALLLVAAVFQLGAIAYRHWI